jgi:hypothetical protein
MGCPYDLKATLLGCGRSNVESDFSFSLTNPLAFPGMKHFPIISLPHWLVVFSYPTWPFFYSQHQRILTADVAVAG